MNFFFWAIFDRRRQAVPHAERRRPSNKAVDQRLLDAIRELELTLSHKTSKHDERENG